MGTPIGQELQARTDETPDVLNDFDVDVSQYPELMLAFANDQRNVRKVREASEKLEVHVMNEPREGKPLLVLDLDYSECSNIFWHSVLVLRGRKRERTPYGDCGASNVLI